MRHLIRVVFTVLTLLLSACGGGGGSGDEATAGGGGTTDTLLTAARFSDPALEQCVQSNALTNGWTLTREVTSLDCSQANIRLLSGLQSLTNLTELNLSGNRIADISRLGELLNLSSVDLSAISDLRNIDALLTLNRLTSVNLSDTGNGDIACSNLDALSLTSGSVTPPQTCKRLISDVVFADTLLQACVTATASRNGVTFTREITALVCDASGISQLGGIQSFQQLQSVSIGGNQISDLTPLAQLVKLVHIDVAQNPVTDVSMLTALPALISLNLSQIPQLNNIDALFNSTTLRELNLNGSGNGELSCASMDSLSTQLDSLSRSSNCKQLISNVQFSDPALRQCVLDKASVAGISFTSELNNIICSGLGITSLDGMGAFTNVEALTFDNNQITDLGPLRNLLRLRGLLINNNNVTDFFALDHLTELRLIEARNNINLSNVNTIVYMGNVKFLRLSGSGAGQKISCTDLDRLSADILSRQIGDPTSPPEFEPPETCNGVSTTGINSAATDMDNAGASDILLEFDPSQSQSGLNSWQMGLSGFGQFNVANLVQIQNPGQIVSARAIAVADANNDNFDDLLLQVDTVDSLRTWQVLGSDGSTLSSSAGNAISIFEARTGDDARAVAFRDINADGYADILIQAQGVTTRGNVNYYVSFGGAASFSTPEELYRFDQKLGRPEIIALEDVNGDGTADLVFERKLGTRRCYFVRAFINGAFEAQSGSRDCAALDLPHEMQLKTVGVADMTGNGRSELVISYVLQGRTEWSYYTLGQGARGSEWTFRQFFSSAEGFLGSQRSIAVADLNMDGRADILSEVTLGLQKKWVAHLSTDYGQSIVQTWLTGNANSTAYRTVGLRDYDGDGDLDLLIDIPQGISDQRLYVKINDNINFESEPWTVWYQNPVSATIIGVEEDGLTTLAHDNTALIARMGSTIKYTENDLREELASIGLSLQTPAPGSVTSAAQVLVVNECRLTYDDPMVDVQNQSAQVSWGMLVCSQQIGDHVSINATALYGECEHKGPGSGMLKCEASVAKAKLNIDVGGVIGQEIGVSGPSAEYCGGITTTGACAGFGADVVSGSGKVNVGNSSVGGSAGFGFGATAGAELEDGVFAGKLGGKFIGGFTVEITVDFKEIYSFSEDAYLFVEDGAETVVLAAGTGIIDAVNTTGDVAGVVAGESIYLAGQGISAAVVVFTVVGDSIVDIVNGIESGLSAGVGFISDVGSGIGNGFVSVFDSIFG